MIDIPQTKQFAVIGAGRFGAAIAKELCQNGREVLVVDSSSQVVSEISDFVTHAIVGDTTEENVLKAVGIRNFDIVIVAIGSNMQASILTTLMCKEMGVKFVVAKAQNLQHQKVLEKIGADLVVFPEESAGTRLAVQLATPNLLEVVEIDANFKIVEVALPQVWIGKSLMQLQIRQKHNLTILLVKRGKEVFATFSSDFVLEEHDICVVAGENFAILKFLKLV